MISKPCSYLVGLGGITGRDFLSLAFHPGLAKGHSPALTGDSSREMKVCSARRLCRGPRSKNPPPPFPSSSLKTQRGGEEKSLEA